jgi:hypothetical protein
MITQHFPPVRHPALIRAQRPPPPSNCAIRASAATAAARVRNAGFTRPLCCRHIHKRATVGCVIAYRNRMSRRAAWAVPARCSSRRTSRRLRPDRSP